MRAAALALFLVACSSDPESPVVVAPPAVAESPDAAGDAVVDAPLSCEMPDDGRCFPVATRSQYWGRVYRAECSGWWIAESCKLTGDVYCCPWW